LLALGAAKLELLAYTAGQALRFGSSLVLSRLLFPEAFGLSVIVGVVGQGLVMLSNVGASQSIVHNKRGDDIGFLNTAWTVLAVRGCLLWLMACGLAWPLSWLLRKPELVYLIPVGSLAVLIGGFSSTSLHTLRRHLRLRPLIAIELASQLLSFVVNVAFALWLRSVWALIIGTLVGAIFSTVASHFIRVGYRNRFQWERDAWREIYDYGRWIQRSSALSFVSGQADRFLIAHYANMSVLGVYNFAAMLADAISSAVLRITHGVLFPVFSQINRDDPVELMDTYYRVRLRMDVLALLPLGIVAASAPWIVDLLFDARYAEAGWMLQALCLRAAMFSMLTPVETFLFAIGQTHYGFYRDLARSCWILPGIPLGWALAGQTGVVWVVALSEIPVLLVLWFGFAKHGGLRLNRELVGPMAFLVGAGGALLVAKLMRLFFS
jgi:O-antigen/teichoic acid export membrane protein